jgi:CRP/FNR family nitrogen fixation transcriptional regulator
VGSIDDDGFDGAVHPVAGPAFRESDVPFRHGLVHAYAAGTGIYAEGDGAERFYKVLSGVARTCRYLGDGQRQVDAFYWPGDLFGFEPDGQYRLTAEAVGDCTLVAYPRLRCVIQDAAEYRCASQLLDYALRGIERAQEHALLLGRRCALSKLAGFLLQYDSHRPGHRFIELVMNRQDIADYLGVTIETVSRSFTQLEHDAVIAMPAAKRIAILDRARLQRIAEQSGGA